MAKPTGRRRVAVNMLAPKPGGNRKVTIKAKDVLVSYTAQRSRNRRRGRRKGRRGKVLR